MGYFRQRGLNTLTIWMFNPKEYKFLFIIQTYQKFTKSNKYLEQQKKKKNMG